MTEREQRIREALVQAMADSPKFAADAAAIADEHGEVLVTVKRDGTVILSEPVRRPA